MTRGRTGRARHTRREAAAATAAEPGADAAPFVVDGDTLHCWFVGTSMKPDKANLLGHAITRDPKLEKWEILTLIARCACGGMSCSRTRLDVTADDPGFAKNACNSGSRGG